jgi:hypothetical protein
MIRPHLTRSQFAIFTSVVAAACFVGAAAGSRLFAPREAHAGPEKPLIINVPADGAYFIGPTNRTLMALREDSEGARVEVFDPQGNRVVMTDTGVDKRLDDIEQILKDNGLTHVQIDREFGPGEKAMRTPSADSGSTATSRHIDRNF